MTKRRDDRRSAKARTMHRKAQRAIKYRATDLSALGVSE